MKIAQVPKTRAIPLELVVCAVLAVCIYPFTGSGPSLESAPYDALLGPPTEADDQLAAETRLPVFELTLPARSQELLFAALPEAGFVEERGTLFMGVDKKWPLVPATFTYEGESYPVKVRFRGWNYDHYMFLKKSWRVRFPKERPFFGLRELNIVNNRKASVFMDFAEHDLLRDIGLLVPDQYPVHMRVNGRYAGVQTVFEQPCAEFFERHGRAVGDSYGEMMHNSNAFESVGIWQKYSSQEGRDERSFTSLAALFDAVNRRDHPELAERLRTRFEIDSYLDYLCEAALTASTNPATHNWRLHCRPESQKFELIPWYQFGVDWPLSARYLRTELTRPADFMYSPLTHAMFTVPEYYDLFLRKLHYFLGAEGRAEELLARAIEWRDRGRRDAYADRNAHAVTQFSWKNAYVSNAEWERAVQDFETSVVIRAAYLERFLRDVAFKAELETDGGQRWLVVEVEGLVPLVLRAVELVGEGGRRERIELDRELRAERLARGVAPEGYTSGVSPALRMKSTPTTHRIELLGAGELEGLRLERVEAVNAVTGEALVAGQAAPELRPPVAGILRTLVIPVADGPGDHLVRVGFSCAEPEPVTIRGLRFETQGYEGPLRAYRERPTETGKVELEPLGEIFVEPGQELTTLPLEVAVVGRRDTFEPRLSNDPKGPVYLPTFTEVLIVGEGNPQGLRLSGVLLAAAGSEPGLEVEIWQPPDLSRRSFAHCGPGWDPQVPSQPYGGPRLASPTPSQRVVRSGTWRVEETQTFPAEVTLVIEPGTRVLLAAGASLLVKGRLLAEGTAGAPVVFARADPKRPWGVLAINSDYDQPSRLEHCQIEGGSEDVLEGVHYMGALSVYSCSALIRRCKITDTSGDDGLNCRFSDSVVEECEFRGNGDGVDFDFTAGAILGCRFEANRGDAIDLSGATTRIEGNVVLGSGDKGISVGERSYPLIVNNAIERCQVGVAVKDSSRTRLESCTLVDNAFGVSVYVKKKHFGPAAVELSKCVVRDNERCVYVDEGCSVKIEHSILDKKPLGPGRCELGDGVSSSQSSPGSPKLGATVEVNLGGG